MGWVRNRPDGTVEAELHGTDADVQAVLDAMAHGPADAHVDGLGITDADAPTATGFEIRHSV